MGVRIFCRLIPSCLMLALVETSADAVGRNSYICFSMWLGIPHTWWLGSKCDHPKTKNRESERANKWVSELGRSYIIIYGLAMDITQHCFYWFPVVEEIKSHSMFKGKVNRVHLSQVSKETWGTEKIARFTLRKYIWPQDPLTHGPL